MLDRYAHWVVRRRRWVLAFAVVALAVGVAATVSLNGKLSFEIFVDKGSEAWHGKEFLDQHFGVAPANLFLLVSARHGGTDDPANARAAKAVVRGLKGEPGLAD